MKIRVVQDATQLLGGLPGGQGDGNAELFEAASEHGEVPLTLVLRCAVFGHTPTLLTGDREVHSPDNVRIAPEAGVQHLVIPRAAAR